jgi:threonine synthase
MQFYSTKNPALKANLKEAIFKGLPEDNGLYMPEKIPVLPEQFIADLSNLSFQEISFEVAKCILGEDIPEIDL